MTKQTTIIDTDPGVDDVLAILLALCNPQAIDLLAITLTHGNISLPHTVRNTCALFSVLEAELKARGLSNEWWFEKHCGRRPTVAMGAHGPLIPEKTLDAAYFHGLDGLGGIHTIAPEFTPPPSHIHLWNPTDPEDIKVEQAEKDMGEDCDFTPNLFTPVPTAAHTHILELLRTSEPDTITIVAIGPLTNIALAAKADPETFSRVKEVVVMGGCLRVPGNVTPGGEFNVLADAEASAIVYALTSKQPHTCLPPHLLPLSPLPKPLKLTLFPLDITNQHMMPYKRFKEEIQDKQGPLGKWVKGFMETTYNTIKSLYTIDELARFGDRWGLEMHDPSCMYYLLALSQNPQLPQWTFKIEDCRVETEGHFTRGVCVVDDRGRQRIAEGIEDGGSDSGNWLGWEAGTRVRVCTGTSGEEGLVGARFGGVLWGMGVVGLAGV